MAFVRPGPSCMLPLIIIIMIILLFADFKGFLMVGRHFLIYGAICVGGLLVLLALGYIIKLFDKKDKK